MAVMEDLKFLWNLVWNPEKYAKRQLNFGNALKLYYTLAVFAFIAYVVVGSLAVAAGAGVHAVSAPFPVSVLQSLVTSVSYVSVLWGGILLFFVVIPLGLAIYAVLYQIIAKHFLNIWKGTYDKTFAALVFGAFPSLLLYWLSVVPVFNAIFIILAPIWGFVVLVVALSAQQKVTRLNALLAVAVTWVLLAALLLLVGLSLLNAVGYVLGSVLHDGVLSFPWHNATMAGSGLVHNYT